MPPLSSTNSWHDDRRRRSESPTPTQQIRPPRYSLSSSALSCLRPISVESPSSCTSLSAQATHRRPARRSFRRERRRPSCMLSPKNRVFPALPRPLGCVLSTNCNPEQPRIPKSPPERGKPRKHLTVSCVPGRQRSTQKSLTSPPSTPHWTGWLHACAD